MKRILLTTALIGSLCVLPAAAANASPAKSYPNCTALNKVYPGGVARAGVTRNKVSGHGEAFSVTPKHSTKLYKKNAGLDRDKDGIACEA